MFEQVSKCLTSVDGPAASEGRKELGERAALRKVTAAPVGHALSIVQPLQPHELCEENNFGIDQGPRFTAHK